MTEPPYILTTVIRQRPGTRATRRHYQLKVATNDGYYWRLTATKLRHLCDAAGDALDTGAGTVGPFHVTCDVSGNYTVLEGHKKFELPENDLIDLIAQGDEQISNPSADISPDNE
ncbi:hypothetical protein [Rhodococcus qingshengii]|uniref:hypothetical protein n=1 Tax=Rhodococcus qingshengii TaxID=334542 RepID=UPI002B001F89|nr:hypothetical protein [Rhodococcus qingshengii]MEA1798654.1 hypothetical protein [Rhodococcus qingshengii]